MKYHIASFAVVAASLGLMASAHAANITNAGSEAIALVVTENGEQTELIVSTAETIEFCLNGCFVTFPNGDRQALTGSETVEINGDIILVR